MFIPKLHNAQSKFSGKEDNSTQDNLQASQEIIRLQPDEFSEGGITYNQYSTEHYDEDTANALDYIQSNKEAQFDLTKQQLAVYNLEIKQIKIAIKHVEKMKQLEDKLKTSKNSILSSRITSQLQALDEKYMKIHFPVICDLKNPF